jgi:hypothetical protein
MSRAPVPDPGEQAQSEGAAINALSELVGPVVSEAIWSAALQTVHLTRPITEPDDLVNVADELARITNNLGRVGTRSLRIRLLPG